MAGNPDQQEDNVDEQYQEEGEEEVGRWNAGGRSHCLVHHTNLKQTSAALALRCLLWRYSERLGQDTT